MLTKSLYDVRRINDFRDLLEQSSSAFADKAAFLVRNKNDNSLKEVSYHRFKSDVDALGAALNSMGLDGSFVAVTGENRYEWCVSYLAVTNHTGVVVPIDKELPVAEKENLLQRSGAVALIFSGRYEKDMLRLKNSATDVKYFIHMDLEEDNENFLSYAGLLERGRKLLSEGSIDLSRHKIDPAALGILLFTSGTTDLAKVV
ncbi:MAG: class I adenylate-forming enzyme family protein, partial [Bacillota bacterium]|nr:class I adenylate-forming enzyme family protein [Bacillota bacterium]